MASCTFHGSASVSPFPCDVAPRDASQATRGRRRIQRTNGTHPRSIVDKPQPTPAQKTLLPFFLF
eukprot:scaffold1130_cov195-Pinguiococcus_pyrenoidosus.AAC.101